MFVCTLAYPQDTTHSFSPTQLIEDLGFLKESLENQHPGLYWYSKAKFDQDFDSIVSSIRQPMTEFDFYRVVSAFNAKIGCGHTNILHEDTYFKRYPNRFPLDIVFIGENALVSSNFSENKTLSRGDEILSINGFKIQDIKEDMIKHITSDGYNQTHKLNKINSTFSEQYVMMIDHPNQYEIEYRKKNADDIQRVILNPIHHDDIKIRRAKINKTPTILFDNNIALWKIKSFLAEDIKKCGKSFKKYYKYVFNELNQRGTENLIIDLRGNHGGIHTACVELFR